MENNIQIAQMNQTNQKSNIIQPYEETGMTRRNFLRLAGLAGAGVISGCALPVAVRKDIKYSDYPEVSSLFEMKPINRDNLELSDFILRKDELVGVRLCHGLEKTFLRKNETNPLMGECTSERGTMWLNQGVPLCEKHIFMEYIGEKNYPSFHFIILANKFKTIEDFEKARLKIKEIAPKEKAPPVRSYSKAPFTVNICEFNVRKANEEYALLEHRERLKNYAEKRGLEFVAGNY